MNDSVTLITGASAGIGRELARVFAANGHHLALVARRVDRLDSLADEIQSAGRPRPVVIPCDLARADAGAVIEQALKAAGCEVAFLVNNAGFGLLGKTTALDRDEQLAMVRVNVEALTDLSLRFTEQIRRQRGGILNVASVAGFLPGPGMAVYYATKAYVLSLTQALHGELRRDKVRVTALCPGPVPTEFQSRAGVSPGLDSTILNVSAQDVAQAGYRGLMRGQLLVLPGAGVKIIPLLLRFAPRRLVLRAVAQVQRGR